MIIQSSLNSLRTAKLSEDLRYRYELEIKLAEEGKRMAFCMLNPSTADAFVDDPTLVRCIGFARREGAARLRLVNLFAYRSRNPKDLMSAFYPEGPENRWHVRQALDWADVFICGWGAARTVERIEASADLCLKAHGSERIMCLGTTRSGAPRHPLYVKKDAPLVRWHP